MNQIFYGISLIAMLFSLSFRPIAGITTNAYDLSKSSQISQSMIELYTEVKPVDIVISAAGDCTLGYDMDFGYNGSYDDVVSKKGIEYPFRNVLDIFSGDDITVVNLETTLTNSERRAEKEFKFKGKPEYAKMLKMSSIEGVNIANNHIYDYLQKGFDDTITNINNADVGFYGEGYSYIKEAKGIKVGFLGYKGWTDNKAVRDKIFNDIKKLKKQCKIVVVSFHWGIERQNYPCTSQQELGRFSIDSGADLVLGHHPHVIQGIETYKGKHIIYSFGNFSYGGHKNPDDKDTFIFRENFRISGKNVEVIDSQVIPCLISSTKMYNNYQPTPVSGYEGDRIIDRLKKYSAALKYGYKF